MLVTRGVVTKNDPLGADGFRMELACPEVAALALPGQFVMVRCAPGVDPLTARPFSLADVSGETISLAYVVVGKGTALLAEMEEGTSVPVLGPLGRPFSYREAADCHVMVAGGIGSAPFPFLARALAEVQPDAERVVLLGGRTRDHLFLAGQFRALGCRLETATDDGSDGHHGLVTDLLSPYLEREGVRFYGCGPTPMFVAMEELLRQSDAPCEVSVEPIMACGFGACYGCVVPLRTEGGFRYVKSCQEGPTFELHDLLVSEMETH